MALQPSFCSPSHTPPALPPSTLQPSLKLHSQNQREVSASRQPPHQPPRLPGRPQGPCPGPRPRPLPCPLSCSLNPCLEARGFVPARGASAHDPVLLRTACCTQERSWGSVCRAQPSSFSKAPSGSDRVKFSQGVCKPHEKTLPSSLEAPSGSSAAVSQEASVTSSLHASASPTPSRKFPGPSDPLPQEFWQAHEGALSLSPFTERGFIKRQHGGVNGQGCRSILELDPLLRHLHGDLSLVVHHPQETDPSHAPPRQLHGVLSPLHSHEGDAWRRQEQLPSEADALASPSGRREMQEWIGPFQPPHSPGRELNTALRQGSEEHQAAGGRRGAAAESQAGAGADRRADAAGESQPDAAAEAHPRAALSDADNDIHLRLPELKELLAYLRHAKPGAACDAAGGGPATQQGPGKVYLVGTGPGDPDLLTLKAWRLLQRADLVLYDRLVSRDVLDLIHPAARLLYVGKAASYHSRTQEEIHALLLSFAEAGATVVRLKGGDPLVFGRGGEEVEYLQAHGIQVDIIPGITSASGIAASLGIPLTHRGLANSVRFLTGHTRKGGEDPLYVAAAAADPDSTLVIYMGLASLPALAAKLMTNGLPQATPAVAVERGTTQWQRNVFGVLEDLPSRVGEARLVSPTLLIVGQVVGLSRFWPGKRTQPEGVLTATRGCLESAPPGRSQDASEDASGSISSQGGVGESRNRELRGPDPRLPSQKSWGLRE